MGLLAGGRQRRWVSLVVTVVAIGSLVVPMGVRPAGACICAAGTVEELRDRTDVGFIGTLMDRGEPGSAPADQYPGWDTPYQFEVERWLHGDVSGGTMVISAPASGGGCGFELRIGEPAAVFATEAGGRYVGGFCSTLPAGVALAQIEPPQAMDGLAVLAVLAVVAGLDSGLVAYFDVDGNYLGSEGELPTEEPPLASWPQRVWPCADGEHVLAAGSGSARLISTVTATEVTAVIGGEDDGYPSGAQCRGPDWARLLWETGSGTARLDDLTTGTSRQPPGLDVFGGDPGLAISPDGERLAVVEVDHGVPAEAATVCGFSLPLSQRPPTTRPPVGSTTGRKRGRPSV